MDDPALGELKDVAVRDVWSHEAHVFTPWLANNLQKLSTVLGVELELMGQEVMVGPYRADIVCRVPTDGTTVLIENQLAHADLQHLGQLLAYLAGLEAKIVIWIAREFGDAHLSALRWLNEHTPDPFSFFAIKVRTVRIGDSLPAPVFEVIERPNEWDRQVRERSGGELSPLGRRYQDFWARLAERRPEGPNPRQGFAGTNFYHLIQESNVRMCQYITVHSVGIYLLGEVGESSDAMLARIETRLDPLRSALETAIDRDKLGVITSESFRVEPAERFPCCVYFSSKTAERDNWDQLADWLADRRKIYQRILQEYPPDPDQSGAGAEHSESG